MSDAQFHLDPNRRHDAVLLFDVTDGNPNGDPDAGNLPRVDPETMQGLMTDVAIKRKVRDWVDATRGEQARFKIYVQSGTPSNELHRLAYVDEKMTVKGSKQPAADVDRARTWMCRNFYDIRSFGAVMTTGVNAGQVRGPVQLTFARSIDQIAPLDISITRIAITRIEDARKQSAEGVDEAGGKVTEMGRKALVPYGLYRAHLFVNPHFGERTGFDGEDLAVLWEALVRMWDLDRSASRGMMACRGLFVFSHEHRLGNAPAHELFERVTVERHPEVATARAFAQYMVAIDDRSLPEGVTLTRLVG